MGLFSHVKNEELCDLCGHSYDGELLCEKCTDFMKKRYKHLGVEKSFDEWIRERYDE